MVVLTIFDSFHSTSGVGDFGQQGIDTFIKDHKCKKFCKSLGLPRCTTIAANVGEPANTSEHEADSDAGSGKDGDDDDEGHAAHES